MSHIDPTVSRIVLGGSVAAPPQFEIVVLSSPEQSVVGRRIALETALVCGRAPDAQLASLGFSGDLRASRNHARFEKNDRGICLVDLTSKNGTYVNGQRIPVNTEQLVAEFDLIRVGDTLLEVSQRIEPRLLLPTPSFICFSPRMMDAAATVGRLAKTAHPVLILGESGTGKEVLASYLHEASGRQGPLVSVNCASVPETLFESQFFGHTKGAFTGAVGESEGFFGRAKHGTLFMDEIGDMPLAQQAKLLRVLENGTYDKVGAQDVQTSMARIVAATNAEVASRDSFRQDLFARLAVGLVHVPPLRRRREDVLPLLSAFLDQASVPARCELRDALGSADLQEQLYLYNWPLNVRELKSFALRLAMDDHSAASLARASRAILKATFRVEPQALAQTRREVSVVDEKPQTPEREEPKPAPTRKAEPKPRTEPMTKERFEAVMREHQGNVYQVSAIHGWHRRQIYRWLKAFDLSLEEFRT